MPAILRHIVDALLLISISANAAAQTHYERSVSEKGIIAVRSWSLLHNRTLLSKAHLAALLQGPVSGPVTYIYDESGRLTAAIDASGNAAVYTYDAVGNILSIRRLGATDFTIISFTPKKGPVGTTVTLYGTGFSATANQNSVQFNGTSAAVISSTTNQIVTTVPVGATTGTITVTSPLGSVISSDTFTIIGSDGRPRINSFSPQIADAGATVTISGANFDTAPLNDRMIVNATTGLNPATASNSSMTLTAPAATGSGHISLSTPNGTVTAVNDLYIPHSPYMASAVSYTGRTTSGTAATATIGTANKIGLLIFDGNKGQMVSVVANNGTFSSGCNFTLYTPTNDQVPDVRNSGSAAGGGCGTSGGFMDSQTLPATGTYALQIVPAGASTGQAVITPYVFNDIGGILTIGGLPFTLTTTVPGQNGKFNFFGKVGQHISITSSGSTFPSCNMYAYDPSGGGLPNTTACQQGQSFGDLGVLNSPGMYTLYVDPVGKATGTVTFQLNDATDITAPITPGGASVTSTTTVVGQNIRLTFSGTAGQTISAVFDNVTFPTYGGNISLLDATGAPVSGINAAFSARINAFLDPHQFCFSNFTSYPCSVATLSSTGTYTLLIDPTLTDTGSIRTSLYSLPADQVYSATFGTVIPVSINTPGQNAKITFSGTQNHKLAINLIGGTFSGTVSSGCKLHVLQPNGAVWVGNLNCMPASTFLDIGTLPATGIYTVILDPQGNTTGSVNATLYDDTDLSIPITADGTPQTFTTTIPGQNVFLNFSGTANQRVLAVINGISGFTTGSMQTSLRQLPSSDLLFGTLDGTTIDICNNGASCAPVLLPAAGNYAVFINPSGTQTGSATVTLYTVPADVSGTTDTAGTPVSVSTSTPGQNAILTFSAISGQTLNVSLTSGIYPAGHCQLTIKRPDNASITSGQDCSGTSHSFGPYSLTQSGTYTITLDPQYAATGGVIVAVIVH